MDQELLNTVINKRQPLRTNPSSKSSHTQPWQLFWGAQMLLLTTLTLIPSDVGMCWVFPKSGTRHLHQGMLRGEAAGAPQPSWRPSGGLKGRGEENPTFMGRGLVAVGIPRSLKPPGGLNRQGN